MGDALGRLLGDMVRPNESMLGSVLDDVPDVNRVVVVLRLLQQLSRLRDLSPVGYYKRAFTLVKNLF